MSAKRRARKRKLTVPVLVLLLILMLGYFMYEYLPDLLDKTGKQEPIPEGSMEIHIIDVGQADSILFKTADETILFDAGTNSSEDELRAYLKNLNVQRINYAIFTHPHEDHIGGADMIINEFNVEKAIIPDAESNTITYDRLMTALENRNVEVYKAVSGDEYNVGAISMTILAPNNEKYSSLNDYSVVVKLKYGNSSFMLTGDAEVLSEKEILSKYAASKLKCDFLKVGHHGSDTSSSERFLDAVRPSVAVISCGEGNKYGHPCSVILERLSARNIECYRTDKEGSIIFICDGNSIVKK